MSLEFPIPMALSPLAEYAWVSSKGRLLSLFSQGKTMTPVFDILRPEGWPRGSCLQGAGEKGRAGAWKFEPGGACTVSA